MITVFTWIGLWLAILLEATIWAGAFDDVFEDDLFEDGDDE